MGVNPQAWTRNTLDLESIEALPALLNSACPGPEIWIWEPDDTRMTEVWRWDGGPSRESIADGHCAIFAAGLSVRVYADVMVVRSLARWRGFLQEADLRSRVRAVTGRVVRTLGASDVIWLPDWFTNEFYPEGAAFTIDGIRRYLLAAWGPPQRSVDSVEEAVQLAAEHSSPRVWFEETFP